MPNTALREARERARLSQTDLARIVQETGFKRGKPNGCHKGTVQRWERGAVPQPHYILLLEDVLKQPAASLGFADVDLGVDRERALTEAGLGSVSAALDPSEYDGPLTGVWRSEYSYYSSSRDATFTSRHYVTVFQRGARLIVHSVRGASSRVSMDMSVNGQVVTGTWTEQTQESGYYSGAVYYGCLQMLLDPTGHRMAGKWVGFGRDMSVNTDAWSLTLVDSEVDEAAVERWNREPA